MARILIVEDSPTAVEQIRRALEPLGHELLLAGDAEQGEAMALEQPPDLIVLDLILPRKNGFELCRALRRNPTTRQVRILMVSQLNRDTDRYWGLKQGADEYLTKPFTPKSLVDKVRQLLGA